MKMMKKLATLMLTVCLLVPCFSILTQAADGKIMFTDPSAKVGETVEVKGVVEKSSGNFGKIEITMTYDTSMLKFKSGDGITETSAGTIQYVGDATNDVGTRKEFKITFDALKTGTATLKIANSTIKNVSGRVLNYTQGSSKITIAAGAGGVTTVAPGNLSEATVDVNGETYQFADAVPQNEIPEGYIAATLDYDLETYNVVYNENTGLYLAYLVNADNIGALFMYVEEDATFDPYESITISDNTTIALLSDVSDIVLPKEYKVTEVVLNDREFPAWRNEDEPDFCIIYAIDDQGVKSLYQLDSAQGTYQRFIAPDVVVEEEDNSLISKLSDVLENHLDIVILGTGLGFLLFIVIIVILSVKLYNRNAELDEIYDEYGIEDKEKTEDDIILDLDDEDDEDDEEDDDYSYMTRYVDQEEADVSNDAEAELLVQEGMREVFPEENAEEEIEEAILEVVAPEKTEEPSEEEFLGKALAQQIQADKEEKDDDDDEFFENFSVDFIDLDE